MLNGTHFELFGLPLRFALDTEALDRAYRTVQTQVHPDRFAVAGGAQKRIAMQWAARVNEAYQTLRDPLKRAVYLLHLRGVDLKAESSTAHEPAFLMQQIEWHERIEEAARARHIGELERLRVKLREEAQQRYDALAALFNAGGIQPAAEAVQQLMFVNRLIDEIDRQIERLEEKAN